MHRIYPFVLLTAAAALPAAADPPAKDPPTRGAGAPAAPALDAKARAEAVAHLDRIVTEKESGKLLAAARKLGLELKASLDYDRPIAKLAAQERLLEQARGDAVVAALAAARERRERKEQLDKDLAEVKQQFKDAPGQGESEQVALVHTYLPTLRGLKQQEERCTQLIRDTTLRLLKVRRDKLSLEKSRKLAEQGLSDGRLVIVPPLPDWTAEVPRPAQQAPPPPKESLQQALQ